MSAKDKQVKQRGNAIISSQLLDARVMDIFREAEIAYECEKGPFEKHAYDNQGQVIDLHISAISYQTQWLRCIISAVPQTLSDRNSWLTLGRFYINELRSWALSVHHHGALAELQVTTGIYSWIILAPGSKG